MEEHDKIVLDMGHQALALAEEHEFDNVNALHTACDILKQVSALISDLVSNHERLVDLTATIRYMTSD